MAEGHPLSVRALFPLLDVCAAVNKHLAKARRFLSRWADVDACPVRLQVPIMMTGACVHLRSSNIRCR